MYTVGMYSVGLHNHYQITTLPVILTLFALAPLYKIDAPTKIQFCDHVVYLNCNLIMF